MKLRYINCPILPGIVRAYVNTTGKLGFSTDFVKEFGITTKCSILIAINEEDRDDLNLYAQIYPDAQYGAFRFRKNAEHFFIEAIPLFEYIGLDYKGEDKTIFDIARIEHKGEQMLKFTKRAPTGRKKKIKP